MSSLVLLLINRHLCKKKELAEEAQSTICDVEAVSKDGYTVNFTFGFGVVIVNDQLAKVSVHHGQTINEFAKLVLKSMVISYVEQTNFVGSEGHSDYFSPDKANQADCWSHVGLSVTLGRITDFSIDKPNS